MKHLELSRAEYVQDLATKIIKANALPDFELAEDLAGVFYDVTAAGRPRIIRFHKLETGGVRDMVIAHLGVFVPENGQTCVQVKELIGDLEDPDYVEQTQDRRFRLSTFICSF